MIAGTRVAAVLMPNSCDLFPEYHWLSRFVGGGEEYPDTGWDNVDFTTLDIAKDHLEHRVHMLRGEKYRP